MAVELRDEPAPLAVDAEGVVRVAGTRVTLDSVVTAFQEGFGAEEIAQQYSSVPLADVYRVIGYYLSHRTTLDVYLQERQAHAERVRAENESRFDPRGVRARLIARHPRDRS